MSRIEIPKKPTNNFIAFAAFVSFFPQLVAGPIERASHLLPQFYKRRSFDYHKAVDGLRQILWGLFKKVVIADNAAEIANAGAEGPRVTHTGWNLRRAGSGGRAGRVHYECLVAGGITGDASDDTQLPE